MFDYDKYYKKTMNRFDLLSNQEMIDVFNKQVKNSGIAIAKTNYLVAIRKQFIKRKIDFSEIGNENSLSYKNKVYLDVNKIKIS